MISRLFWQKRLHFQIQCNILSILKKFWGPEVKSFTKKVWRKDVAVKKTKHKHDVTLVWLWHRCGGIGEAPRRPSACHLRFSHISISPSPTVCRHVCIYTAPPRHPRAHPQSWLLQDSKVDVLLCNVKYISNCKIHNFILIYVLKYPNANKIFFKLVL